jgi:CRP-like cAMP-binding protein
LEVAGILEAIFAQLTPEHLKTLEEIAVAISLKKGAQLFAPEDPTVGFYVIREGAIRIYGLSSQGKEITQEIAGPLSAFALASPFSTTYQYFGEALKDSQIYLIKKKEFLNLIANDPGFAGAWIRLLSMMVIHLRRRLADLTLKNPKTRIASYLLHLGELQNSRFIMLPVSRKELATLLGMTHETFYRSARELENESLVRFAGKAVEILNRTLLTEMTE